MRKRKFIALTLVGLLVGSASVFSQQTDKKVGAVQKAVTSVESTPTKSITTTGVKLKSKSASAASSTSVEVVSPSAVTREVKQKPARKENYSTRDID